MTPQNMGLLQDNWSGFCNKSAVWEVRGYYYLLTVKRQTHQPNKTLRLTLDPASNKPSVKRQTFIRHPEKSDSGLAALNDI